MPAVAWLVRKSRVHPTAAGKIRYRQLTRLGLLACALDESAEITDREVQREVDGGEQLDEEQIPAQ